MPGRHPERTGTERSIGVALWQNPNGSVLDVAGVCNRRGNVLGLMPHPERATDPLLGGIDGQRLLQSLLG